MKCDMKNGQQLFILYVDIVLITFPDLVYEKNWQNYNKNSLLMLLLPIISFYFSMVFFFFWTCPFSRKTRKIRGGNLKKYALIFLFFELLLIQCGQLLALSSSCFFLNIFQIKTVLNSVHHHFSYNKRCFRSCRRTFAFLL